MKETAMNTLFLRCPRALLPAAVTALTLAGCAAKPPACDDPAVVQSIKKMVMDPIAEAIHLTKRPNLNPLTRYYLRVFVLNALPEESEIELVLNLQRPVFARYTEGATIHLNAVTTDGYDSQARRHNCKATIQLQSKATGQTMEVRGVTYTVQATAKAGEFLVEVPGLDNFIQMVGEDAIDYVSAAVIKSMREMDRSAAKGRAPAKGPKPEEEHGD